MLAGNQNRRSVSMFKLVSAKTAERLGPLNGPDQERRQARRVGLSLRLRIRPASIGDGHWEQMQITQNASSKAFYFVTPRDCYREGMFVRVSSPYGSANGSGQWEDTAEVLRVDAKPGGYGVVIQLQNSDRLAPASSQASSPPWELSTARPERRKDRRVPFMACAEVTDMRTGFRMNARISDLSLCGCYVDTLNPLPRGTSARLQIRHKDEVLSVPGRVACHHAASGMGLVFADISEQERKVLEGWLVRPHPRPEVRESLVPSPTRTETRPCAERLVDLLVHKGLLTQWEASELLKGGV